MRLDETSMAPMPIYNQIDVADCYAFATSQMIDAYRFSHGDKKTDHLTSASALAVKYTPGLDRYRKGVQTKLNLYTMPADRRKVYEDFVKFEISNSIPTPLKKEIHAVVLTAPGSIVNTVAVNKEFGQLKSCDHKAIEKYFSKNKDFQEAFDIWSKTLASEKPTPICQYQNNDLENIRRLIEFVKNSGNSKDFFANLFEQVCKGHFIDVGLPPMITYEPEEIKPDEVIRAHDVDLKSKRAAVLTAHANNLLSVKNPQPIGVSYAADFLFKKGAVGKESNHVSVIIGQRRNAAGKCEFLLRNSWGERCDLAVECDPKQKGQYWIDSEELMSNVFGLNSLVDEPTAKELLEKQNRN